MNDKIRTYYALKTITKKRFWWSKAKQITKVVAETRASNWLWAENNFAFDGVKYDKLVLASPIV